MRRIAPSLTLFALLPALASCGADNTKPASEVTTDDVVASGEDKSMESLVADVNMGIKGSCIAALAEYTDPKDFGLQGSPYQHLNCVNSDTETDLYIMPNISDVMAEVELMGTDGGDNSYGLLVGPNWWVMSTPVYPDGLDDLAKIQDEAGGLIVTNG